MGRLGNIAPERITADRDFGVGNGNASSNSNRKAAVQVCAKRAGISNFQLSASRWEAAKRIWRLPRIGKKPACRNRVHPSRSKEGTEYNCDGFARLWRNQSGEGELWGLNVDMSANLWTEIREFASRLTSATVRVSLVGPVTPVSTAFDSIYPLGTDERSVASYFLSDAAVLFDL